LPTFANFQSEPCFFSVKICVYLFLVFSSDIRFCSKKHVFLTETHTNAEPPNPNHLWDFPPIFHLGVKAQFCTLSRKKAKDAATSAGARA
jgi:hypothetical protein